MKKLVTLLCLLVAVCTVGAASAQAYVQVPVGKCYARAGDVYIDLVQPGGTGHEPAQILLGASGSANCPKLTGAHTITMNLQADTGSGWQTMGSETMGRVCNVTTSRYNCTLAADVYAWCVPGVWRSQTFFDGVEIDGSPVTETCQETTGAP